MAANVDSVKSAISNLKSMLEVLTLFRYRFEFLEIEDHIKRVFDLVLSSPLFDNFSKILREQEDINIANIKLDTLKCIGLLSVGCRLFSKSDISIDFDSSVQFLERTQLKLLNQELIINTMNLIRSNCIELRE